MSTPYGEDLAWVHHNGFGEFAESAAPGLLEILWRQGVNDGLVVDIGCGSGIWARALTRAGFRVHGIDPSAAMLALARTTAPDARFELGSFVTCEIPPCDAITAVGEVLNYGRRDELPPFFARAARALRPGGVLVFDVAERESYPPYDEHRVDGDDWVVFARKESDGTHLTRRVTTFRGERRSEEVHRLELHAREDLVAMLRAAFFRVRIRRSYGSRRLPKKHAVYVTVANRPDRM
ncbi:MAG TPA: class I SAM-dependent methyltransferase [Thermoanaerobaculia bacterium]|nr:class I SAM-dependent methyltransferase [Thermoanaerobaculia bacterium]